MSPQKAKEIASALKKMILGRGLVVAFGELVWRLLRRIKGTIYREVLLFPSSEDMLWGLHLVEIRDA